MRHQRFSLIPGEWAIARLEPDAHIPAWAIAANGFASITRTADELSITCPAAAMPESAYDGSRWSLFKLHGPFSFAEVGVLSSVTTPLAEAGLSIFAISTFETDYVLVKQGNEGAARQALMLAGHTYGPEQ